MEIVEVTREKFIEYLRDALSHLYHADHLRNSPLIDLFGLSTKFDPAASLRKIILDGIEALKPSLDQPEQSRSWRVYDSLFCCYVQQLSQQIVADQLCISDRQLRREQRLAIEELASILWEKHQIDPYRLSVSPENVEEMVIRELSWVRQPCAEVSANLHSHLHEVLDLCYALGEQNGVEIKVRVPESLPGLIIHPVALNQILLNVILDIIHRSPGGMVEISAQPIAKEVMLTVRGEHFQKGFTYDESENPGNVRVAQQIADLSGIQHNVNPVIPEVILRFPICEDVPVLVIDDNEDALSLMTRFASGSRFKIISVHDLNQVFSVVETEKPRVIILDIMMPQENGWMVLARLKQNPLTSNCPIIICSVLPQENLAMTLGASGYLKKPFTREAFFRALEQQAFWMEQGSDSSAR